MRERAHHFPHLAIVKDRGDPANRGRVRVQLPAVYGKALSPWALPIGMPMSGASGRGFFAVPDLESIVCVFFLGGDPDRPAYASGPWAEPGGVSEAPDDGKETPPDVRVLETGSWLLEFDDRDPPRLLVRLKDAELHLVIAEGWIELHAPSVNVKVDCNDASVTAGGKVEVTAAGKATVQAETVELNGQAGDVVTTGTHPVDYVTGAPINGVPTVKAG